MSDHVPVMLTEVLEALAPRDGGRYIDGTLGGGGYARAILETADSAVLGIDRDPDAIVRGIALKERFAGRFTLLLGRFSAMDTLAKEPVDGVVLDLGVSSFQLDESGRGFSFHGDGPLDMRMSRDGESAADFINTADERVIADVLFRYGEERKARSLARAIVANRPMTRTRELVAIVEHVLGPAARRYAIHPATRTFQALRIHVNDELGELERGLQAATRVLANQGRLVVVCFHSLEDRVVKSFLAERSIAAARPSRHSPDARSRAAAMYRLITKRPWFPSTAEIQRNPRARSARLRAAVRIRA